MNKEKHYQRLSAYLTSHKQQPKKMRDEMLSILLDELKPSYYRRFKTLRIIWVLSTMIGLLGTVLGIISAFKIIALLTGPVSPSMIADGLWEAMLTTATGLTIALPALLIVNIFHYFNDRKINQYCLQLNKLSIAIELEKYEKYFQRKDVNIGKLLA